MLTSKTYKKDNLFLQFTGLKVSSLACKCVVYILEDEAKGEQNFG